MLLRLLALACPASVQDVLPADDWPWVGGDPGGMRYSTLEQIDVDNVDRLELAWTWHTGELERGPKTIECTPLVLDGAMYLTTAHLRVVCLDAASGEERWSFDPFAARPRSAPLASGGVNRGLASWSDGVEGGERRILFGSAHGVLYSLDARTGQPDPDFGAQGAVDLRAGLERDLERLPYGPTSAPNVVADVVVLGFSCGEGPGDAAPGDVRAFDVRTGEERWRFRTVPAPGEFGHESWEGESWRNRGGANAWGGVSVDVERGWAFVGLGSAAFDFYGGDRLGDNLFANCVVAIDARSGERIWHHQTLRHDLWDHDLPTYPNLVRITVGGETRDAVAQVTKTGYCYVFDRDTGEPYFELVELEAPASDVPGERSAPRQAVPSAPPPFVRTSLGMEDITRLSEAKRAAALERLEGVRWGGAFEPPSLGGTLVVPGFHGGANWSGACFDPTSNLLYVNANELPNLLTLVESRPNARHRYSITGYHRFLDDEGYPAITPPWGTLTALDLARGTIAWQRVLGEYPELSERGLPPTGTHNFGGSIVTAGGLVFIGATADERFHAFDAASGELLWESALPAGGYATPCTYAVDGRQYVCIAAGGAGKVGTRGGDAFVAYALPAGD